MVNSKPSRLAYIDWMRGLACLLMFQTHCYDAWLSPPARRSTFYMWSQIGGTLPAPLFLFLAGVAFALVVDKLRERSVEPNKIAATTIRRGAEILGLGLLFRLQQFAMGFPWAPWTDLLRVDVLNIIGISMIGMGVLCWLILRVTTETRPMAALIAAALFTGSVVSLITPLIWTSWRPRWLPWFLESYIDGVHNLGEPQPWLFPIFPWCAFAFFGLAAGFLLRSKWVERFEGLIFASFAFGGLAVVQLGRWLDTQPQIYSVYDFWHTSPNFFLIRIGFLLTILGASYAWCRWGLGQWRFSPLIQLGQTSLLVYWVHIEFVYGRLSILPKRAMQVRGASFGLLVIFSAMLLLSILRVRYKGRGWEIREWVRRPVSAS